MSLAEAEQEQSASTMGTEGLSFWLISAKASTVETALAMIADQMA